MKVLYIHQYFVTPEEGGPLRSYYLSKGLVEAGHEVGIITAHNSREYLSTNIEGITVHYLPVYYDNKLGFIGRTFAFLKFVILAYKKARAIQGIDICYASSTPLTVGIIALLLKKNYNIPFYFEVRDLWPEAPIQLGYIKNFIFKKYLRLLEKKIYTGADKIIALSQGMRDGIETIVPQKPVYVIPNIADCDFFQREIKDAILEKKFGVAGKFVITYFGAVGKANHLEYLINVIAESKKENLEKIFFLIAGKGSELSRIKNIAKEKALTNVLFFDYMNKYALRDVLNITDAAYISFAKNPILETSSPNKLFDGLAAGKLVIGNTKGCMKEIIEKAECGFYADPESPAEFIEKIKPFLNDPELLIQYQHNSRRQAELYFSRNIQTQKFLKLFNNESKMESVIASAYTLTV